MKDLYLQMVSFRGDAEDLGQQLAKHLIDETDNWDDEDAEHFVSVLIENLT